MSSKNFRDRGEVRAIDDAIENFSFEPAALERSHDQVQVHVVLTVKLGSMKAHPELIFTLFWVSIFEEFIPNLFHVA